MLSYGYKPPWGGGGMNSLASLGKPKGLASVFKLLSQGEHTAWLADAKMPCRDPSDTTRGVSTAEGANSY